MKNLVLVLMLFFTFATPAFANYEQSDIDALQKKITENTDFNESGFYDRKAQQVVKINTRIGAYVIDFKAKICILQTTGSTVVVPCKKVKEGYPMFAPLMPWAN